MEKSLVGPSRPEVQTKIEVFRQKIILRIFILEFYTQLGLTPSTFTKVSVDIFGRLTRTEGISKSPVNFYPEGPAGGGARLKSKIEVLK